VSLRFVLTLKCSDVHILDDEHRAYKLCFIQLTSHSSNVILECWKDNLPLWPISWNWREWYFCHKDISKSVPKFKNGLRHLKIKFQNLIFEKNCLWFFYWRFFTRIFIANIDCLVLEDLGNEPQIHLILGRNHIRSMF